MDWCRVVGPRGLCRPLDESFQQTTPCKGCSKCEHAGQDRAQGGRAGRQGGQGGQGRARAAGCRAQGAGRRAEALGAEQGGGQAPKRAVGRA